MAEENFIRPDEFWNDLGLRAEQSVAHLGAGPGYYIIPAAHIVGHKGKIIAIDVLPDLLAEISHRAKREGVEDIVSTVRANLENDKGSTLNGNSMDWVLVANILHQSDPEKILREAARIVAPAGRIVIVEWGVGASPFGPPVQMRIAKQQVVETVQNLGLHIIKEFDPSPYHYGLVVSK